MLLLLCCHFCSFLLLLLWSWQNLWQENSAFRQSLTWWKNPKDCVLAVHGGRPKLQYIKCHPNFLVFFTQLWWRWKLAWKRSLISSYNVLFFIKAALCTCSVIFKIRVHCVGVIAVGVFPIWFQTMLIYFVVIIYRFLRSTSFLLPYWNLDVHVCILIHIQILKNH